MDSIKKLIDLFRRFPTVGPRTASRFVFYLVKMKKEEIDELTNTIQELKNKIRFCQFCFNPFEPLNSTQNGNETIFCPVCSDPRRDKKILCVVEKENDLISIEKTKKYKGLYFVLGGTVATMKKDDISNLRIEQLKARVIKNGFIEIIIAINPTPEGRATSILVERKLKEIESPAFKITHLAQGIPVGGELEYADEETLESAFEGRK